MVVKEFSKGTKEIQRDGEYNEDFVENIQEGWYVGKRVFKNKVSVLCQSIWIFLISQQQQR